MFKSRKLRRARKLGRVWKIETSGNVFLCVFHEGNSNSCGANLGYRMKDFT